jgi:hypothetical protein
VGSQTRLTHSFSPDAFTCHSSDRSALTARGTVIDSYGHLNQACLLRLYCCPSNVLLQFDFSTIRAGMMCRLPSSSCLLLVSCYLVASFELATAASMPIHFHCTRWTFELTLESDLW